MACVRQSNKAKMQCVAVMVSEQGQGSTSPSTCIKSMGPEDSAVLSSLVLTGWWELYSAPPFLPVFIPNRRLLGITYFHTFFKMRWWQIGGEAKLLCIITLVLWHVRVVARVSFRLLGLSDDELDPLCPPVPFLWDPLNCTPFGTGNCFDVSPFSPCNVNSLSTEHSILSVCLWLGTAEKGNSWASQTPAKGKPSLKFSCKWPESKESI